MLKIDVVSENLGKGEDVSIIGFGTFSVAERSVPKARNFRQVKFDVAALKTVKFKVGKTLKEAVSA